jgi:hypothetical protein
VIARTHAMAVLALAVAGFGCGAGSDGSCGATQPCGGDPVGAWTITDGCSNRSVAASELMTIVGGPCPGLAITSIEDHQSGTVTLNADRTFTASYSITGSITAAIPASCFDQMPCAALETFLGMEGLLVHGCTGTATCACTIDRVPQALDGAGTYMVTGSQLELHPDSAPNVLKQFCAADSTLHLTGVNGSTIVDDVVLARQTR